MLFLKSLLLFCSFKCFLNQEFTFGGATEEDENNNVTPNITFDIGNNGSLVKSEMEFLRVTCNISNYNRNMSIRWLDSLGRVAASNYNLYVKSLLKSDEGKYNCTVESMEAPSKLHHKILDLKITIPSITIEILPGEVLKVGGKVKRQCSDLGLPENAVVDQFSYTWLDSQRRTVGNSKTLEIPIVDESITGTYTCQMKSAERSKIYEATTTVDLKSATNFKISIKTNPTTFQYEERFSMLCLVEPTHPDMKYSWYQDNKLISNDREILFKAFNKKHIGLYKCVVSMMLGNNKMVLEAESPQQFSYYSESKIELDEILGKPLVLHRGDKKELHCEIDSNSDKRGVDTTWFINGIPLKETKLNNIKRLDRKFVSMLIITNIDVRNEGIYDCRVGSIIKKARLVVQAEPGLIEISPSLLTVNEGRPVEFHCRAENIADVKNTDIKWRYESKDGSIKYDIPDSRWTINNPSVAEQTSFIDLFAARVLDNGYYICTEPSGKTAKSELIVIPSKDANYITITPKEIQVRSGQRIEIDCYTKNTEGRASGHPQFNFKDNRTLGRDSKFVVTNVGPSHIRLTAPKGLPLSDNDLDVECSSGFQRASSKIYIKDICPPGYRYCHNGECLENSKFCDKNYDCADKSDENIVSCRECDPISKQCKNHNGEIPKKNYFLIHWICDGEEDCGNGFDETNCGDLALDNCGGKYFKCSDGKSIPRGYLCDENVDCANGEDERGCTPPQITDLSTTIVKAKKSEKVVLTCEASGKPLPVIVWRFNWGCVSSVPRISSSYMSSNCTTASSRLEINNFQPGDDGIYNCEALSSQQRAFSNDIHVLLRN